jgi:hypothetical protein
MMETTLKISKIYKKKSPKKISQNQLKKSITNRNFSKKKIIINKIPKKNSKDSKISLNYF